MSRIMCLSFVHSLLLVGCQSPSSSIPHSARPVPVCAGGKVMMKTTLWFGLSKPQGGNVSSVEWMHFIDNEVTPRFKSGLSVYDAQDQWPGKNGLLAREKSKALVLVYHSDMESNGRVEELRTLYKKQFGQESVMRVDTPACISF
ncbi:MULTISPECIES: DUF3574 domain-containing protein [Pantoea]|uniref:DUF3574 domain-containing protein n=1 Tax=Pantoea TaxID=53335 RepID=UPI00048AED52|nr:DUF3574 domain-containing protein [Pantoea ananatis]QZE31349.1 DUF3574 domain-containing protein [Pantoea ananatis]